MKTPVSGFQRPMKSKATTEIMKEIAMLELEVMHLERHLLSLYEKAFDRRITSPLCSDFKDTKQVKVSFDCSSMSYQDEQVSNSTPLKEYYGAQDQQDIVGSSIHRSHSSLSRHSAYPLVQSPPLTVKIADAVHSYHSLPLRLLENATAEASDYAMSYDSCQTRQTANWVSEEMIRCISTIYCKLAANTKTRNIFSSPVVSSISLMSCSTSAEFHLWSPLKMNSSLDLNSDVSVYGSCQEFSGPYTEMIEVLHICRDSAKMKEINPTLQKFSSLVRKLEAINPSKLKHEEKLAFWINVHNALVMHAYLVYGVSQIKLKRVSLLLKAAYNIGGQTVSAGMMQNFILGSRLPFLGQWLLHLFHRNTKSRKRDDTKGFATDHSEPLSYFALCCGSRSDPPVRVYTPKRVYQELIAARGDYILSNYKVNKEQNKVLLPKTVETYAKDSGLHPEDFRSILEQIIPADLQRSKVSRYHWLKKGQKGIGWIPHDFSFRYQFHMEMS
ncbi:uncharacterized protein LOC141611232 [Silene latifolia]|uniref:uncharacterized protein LOC141611232 n=1 Tax=Silene latifolia TaxID=37657 RepID=UPI003D783900